MDDLSRSDHPPPKAAVARPPAPWSPTAAPQAQTAPDQAVTAMPGMCPASSIQAGGDVCVDACLLASLSPLVLVGYSVPCFFLEMRAQFEQARVQPDLNKI